MDKVLKKIRCTASSGDCDCDYCFGRFGRLLNWIHLKDNEYLIEYEKETC